MDPPPVKREDGGGGEDGKSKRRPPYQGGRREDFPAFPFEPYDVQVELMSAVYGVLEKGGVGIVESPTGTGKTLSLLCSSLQWLLNSSEERQEEEEEAERRRRSANASQSQGSDGDDDDDSPDWIKDFEVEKQKSRLLVKSREWLTAPKGVLSESNSTKAVHWGGGKKGSSAALSNNNGTETALREEEEDFLLENEEMNSSGDGGKRRAFPLLLDDDESESDVESDTEVERSHRQIFYCSRTHSQLAQVVKELKGTALASQVSSAVLGSRKGLCINDKVLGLNSVSRMNEECIQLQQKRNKNNSKKSKTNEGGESRCSSSKGKCGCPFLRKKDKQEKLVRSILQKPMDIEDIGQLAEKVGSCGYYAARKAALDADIVFLPYNSVLSKNVRDISGVRVKDSIVIIDEAHNIADAVNNMHSVVLNLGQLRTAKMQVTKYHSRFKNMFSPSNSRNVQMILRLVEALLKCFFLGSGSDSKEKKKTPFQQSSRIVTVNEFLSETGIDNINIFRLSEFVRESKLLFKVSGYYEVSSLREGSDAVEVEKLGSLNAVMDLLLALTNNEDDGRVIIDREAEQVKFVMLNAATHFESLVREAHAVVLAGGTLQPLEDLFLQVMPTIDRAEVQTVSCDHVVDKKNLMTMTVPKGPTGKSFDFVHSKRTSPEMMMDLGRLVVNACKVVPDGVVCFFPSYKYSDQVTSFWSENGIMDLIKQRKAAFGEPKAADEVESVLSKFKCQIESEEDARGAILFCVVGGKMSEGINFSDRLGRCVILAGLPYPNLYDQELNERLKYLDSISERFTNKTCGGVGVAASAASTATTCSSSTREHMENICMKAVNQTIGRAIRHKNDYACILLADRRYCTETGPFRKLPQWIKQGDVTHCENFGMLYRSLVSFFRRKAQQ